MFEGHLNGFVERYGHCPGLLRERCCLRRRRSLCRGSRVCRSNQTSCDQQDWKTPTLETHERATFVMNAVKGIGAGAAQSWQSLCGWSARRKMPHGASLDAAKVLRFGCGARFHQNGDAGICRSRLNGLMAKMTNRTGVRRGSRVTMPDNPQRRPDQQGEECDGKHQSPDCSSTRHFCSAFQRPSNRVRQFSPKLLVTAVERSARYDSGSTSGIISQCALAINAAISRASDGGPSPERLDCRFDFLLGDLASFESRN